MDFEISQEHKEFNQRVREFVEATLTKEYIEECEANDEYPYAFWEKMAKAGYCGLLVPVEYGGVGGGAMEVSLFMEELTRRFMPAAVWFLVASVFGAEVMNKIGSEELKRKYLPLIAKGEVRFCFGVTEPSGGADVLSLSTFATEKGDEFVINGEKIFTTGADVADYIFLIARTKRPHEVAKRSEGLSMIMVPRNTPGISMRKLEKMGWQGVHTCEVFYDDVRVPKSNLLGEKHDAWPYVTFVFNVERVSMAGIMLGIQEATFEYALNYAKQRQAFGRPIGQFQAIQHNLADMYVRIETARMWTHRLAWMADQGMQLEIEAMMAKLVSADNMYYIARRGMEIMGGHGFIKDHDMEKYYRAMIPIAPPDEMCRNYIGHYRLGLPRSY